MRDNYRFSVLMSLYDKEKPEYLNECLESISHQTLMPDEIVIVLDGPVNINLMTVLDKWIKIIPIVIYKIERNVGLGNALNFGISKCKNEIIARMDTDDICMPNRFDTQISLMNKYPNLSVLGGAIIEFSSDDEVFGGLKQIPLTHAEIVKYSKYRNPINHMTVVFNKAHILSVGGYRHHPYMEDYNLWLRLLSNNRIFLNISLPLVKARTGRDMIERRKGYKYILSEYELFKLKRQLAFGTFFELFPSFAMRVLVRLLPVFALSMIYKKIRKGV